MAPGASPLAVPLVAALTATLLASGCAGSGVVRFDQPGFGVVFSYPSQMSLHTDVRTSTQTGDVAPEDTTVAVALDEYNLITISRHALRARVTSTNLDQAKPEFDRLITQLAPTTAAGAPVQHGGLPGLEYQFAVPSPPTGQSRYTILFDGDTQYTLDCQSTTEERTQINQACDTALNSLHRR